jgi:acetyl esterase/lipase
MVPTLANLQRAKEKNMTIRSSKETLPLTIAACLLMLSAVLGGRAGQGAEPTIRDLAYAQVNGQAMTLDLYLPPKLQTSDGETNRPLIIWVHGGAWRAGNKSDVPIQPMLSDGFAIASVEYRLSPVAKFPAAIHDIKAAIRFLRAHALTYRLDSRRFVVGGSSAGGHLAALVGVSGKVAELEGNIGEHPQTSSEVQAIVSFYGAANLQTILSQSTPYGRNMRIPALQLFLGGQPEEAAPLARLASPVAHVDAGDPPLWLVHGDQDPQMPIEQSIELESRYRQLRLPVKFEKVVGGKHGGAGFFTPPQLAALGRELKQNLQITETTPAEQ